MVPCAKSLHSAFSSTTFSASVKMLATANKLEFLKLMGRVVPTSTSYPNEPSQMNLLLGVPDTLPHCLPSDYQNKKNSGDPDVACDTTVKEVFDGA